MATVATVAAARTVLSECVSAARNNRYLMASMARRTLAAASSPPPPPLSEHSSLFRRLPRPSRNIDPFHEESERPHSITLFPGDFSDDGDSVWGDDGDDGMDSDDDTQGEVDETELMGQQLQKREADERAQKEKWIKNSIPPVWEQTIDQRGRAYGRGGRKTASARVWIQPGLGEVVVNRRPLVEYFDRLSDRELVLQPFVATETCGAFDVQVSVQGGGLTGQAGAVRHGLARALNAFDPDRYRPPLKRLGLLERDYRKVERKKVGRKKARKSPQWVRR